MLDNDENDINNNPNGSARGTTDITTIPGLEPQFSILSRLFSVNRGAAIILWVGLSVFSTVSIISTWFSDYATITEAAIMGLIIIGIGVFLVIISSIIENSILRIFIGYCLTIMLFTVTSIFIYASVVVDPDPFQKPICMIYFLLYNCEDAKDINATTNNLTTEGGRANQIIRYEAPPKKDIDLIREKYNISIKFAGYKREVIKEFALELNNNNWIVEGADRGGERRKDAINLAQVRYGVQTDKSIAESLANDIKMTRVNDEIKAVFNPDIEKGVLEVWIGLK